SRHSRIDGRPRPLAGQCVHRTAVAQPEIRVRLPARIRDRLRLAERPILLDQLLQRRTPALRFGRDNAKPDVWDNRRGETGGLTTTRAKAYSSRQTVQSLGTTSDAGYFQLAAVERR